MTEMKQGFVYYNPNQKLTPDYKILNLSRSYFNKFNKNPTVCHVNPNIFPDVIGEYELNTPEYKVVHGIRVEPDELVQANEFYFGEIE